jgi:cupin 2 domain-containing protein
VSEVRSNLFRDLPRASPDEMVQKLLIHGGVRIERIVSTGQSTPEGVWYDQSEGEWVVLLRGEAGLRFEDMNELMEMRPGDHVFIAPNRKHRVEWTSDQEPTLWLAIFLAPESPKSFA